MGRLASLWMSVRRHKYAVTVLLFAILIIFFDENSLIRRWQLTREEATLRREVSRYRAQYEEDTRKLNELTTDSEAIERIAREKYLMKKDNEDIFVISEK